MTLASPLWSWWARLFSVEIWNIGFIERDRVDLEQVFATGRLPEAHWCTPAARHKYRADPFIWHEAGATRVLFEEYSWWRGRANISSIPLGVVTDSANVRIDIVEPHHLSYPQIIHCDGTTYCIPESAEAGGVDLYAWDSRISRWSRRSRLVEGRVLDPTLFYIDDTWYMFGTLAGERGPESLHIWRSRELVGPWTAHPLNPIGSPSGCNRSAGPVFASFGRFYRPVQDNSNGYGSGILLRRIDVLTPDLFSETCICRLGPRSDCPYPNGLHTLSIDSEFVLLDGKRVEHSLFAPIFKVIWRVLHAVRTIG
jgi:hypothetical protein